jgi:FolB domain-containing protein
VLARAVQFAHLIEAYSQDSHEGGFSVSQDRIHVSDLLLRCIIGFNDWEREKKQDVLINLTLYTDMKRAGQTDNPDDVLDYRTLTKDVIAYVEKSEHRLVEALAAAIARIAVVGHGADRVVVSVQKPGALRFARSVGVEIERERADFD